MGSLITRSPNPVASRSNPAGNPAALARCILAVIYRYAYVYLFFAVCLGEAPRSAPSVYKRDKLWVFESEPPPC